MRLILADTLITGVISAVTAPIPGTSLLVTALEGFMIVHIVKAPDFKPEFPEIGYSSVALWSLSTLLKDTTPEILTYPPGLV